MERTAITFLFIGIIIAGSDGRYFPWINFVGLLIAFVGYIILENKNLIIGEGK